MQIYCINNLNLKPISESSCIVYKCCYARNTTKIAPYYYFFEQSFHTSQWEKTIELSPPLSWRKINSEICMYLVNQEPGKQTACSVQMNKLGFSQIFIVAASFYFIPWLCRRSKIWNNALIQYFRNFWGDDSENAQFWILETDHLVHILESEKAVIASSGACKVKVCLRMTVPFFFLSECPSFAL